MFLKVKIESSAKEFCQLNKTPWMAEALEECYKYQQDEMPDYSKLRFLLQNSLLDGDLGPTGKYYKPMTRSINSISDESQLYDIEESDETLLINQTKA